MTSLADIPDQLMHREKYMTFLNWLFQYPLGWTDTHRIIRLWSRATGRPMRASDWSAIETRWLHRNARP